MIDWRHWHNEPFLIGGLIFSAWLYAVLTGPLRARFAASAPYPKNHAVRFYVGLLVFYVAVGSPLDQIGERFLLSAHMVQHQLLVYVSALLCLTGLPPWLFAGRPHSPAVRTLRAVLLHPVSCAIVYSVVLSAWHAPGLYDWALRDKTVHVLEHLMFFGAAVFYWWPLVSPDPGHPPIRFGAQIIYVFSVAVAMTPVFAFLAFADNVLYPTYEYAPRLITDFSPASDQLLGAAIMKTGSIVVTLVAMIIAFYRWYQSSERRTGQV